MELDTIRCELIDHVHLKEYHTGRVERYTLCSHLDIPLNTRIYVQAERDGAGLVILNYVPESVL